MKYEGIAPSSDPVNAGKPMYSFFYQNASNQIPYVNSYQDNTSMLSRWQAQIGIRYIFS